MDIYEKMGTQPAFDEAENSGLPGLRNGPADAYRHIIGAAELTRRHGETAARAMLQANEIKGDYWQGQSLEERRMDEHNNKIGIAIGKDSRTYDEVVQRAREKIDQGVARNGDGAEDTPQWPDQSKWEVNPESPNWPPDWSSTSPPGGYDYGGEKHRYRPRSDADPLERPIETWSEDDVGAVMASDAYQRGDVPGHQLAQERVRDWFVHFYGDGPARVDVVGRLIAPAPIRPIPTGSGPVHVRQHVRDGGKIAVDAHDRARPSS